MENRRDSFKIYEDLGFLHKIRNGGLFFCSYENSDLSFVNLEKWMKNMSASETFPAQSQGVYAHIWCHKAGILSYYYKDQMVFFSC
jgi:hypothetical protein